MRNGAPWRIDRQLECLPADRQVRMQMQVPAVEREAGDPVDECMPHAAHCGDVETFLGSSFAIVEIDRGGQAQVSEGPSSLPARASAAACTGCESDDAWAVRGSYQSMSAASDPAGARSGTSRCSIRTSACLMSCARCTGAQPSTSTGSTACGRSADRQRLEPEVPGELLVAATRNVEPIDERVAEGAPAAGLSSPARPAACWRFHRAIAFVKALSSTFS